jgi:hypothetical protein
MHFSRIIHRGSCWVSMVVRLSSTNEGGTRMMSATTGHEVNGTEISANQSVPQVRSPCGSIYSGRSNALLKYLKSP